MENKINLFGKSFNFNTGAVVKWNNFSERKDFYGILIEMKEVLSFGESCPKAVLAIKLRHISDKKLFIDETKGALT